jgi:hypothetical protein
MSTRVTISTLVLAVHTCTCMGIGTNACGVETVLAQAPGPVRGGRGAQTLGRDFDEQAEAELALADLHEQIPGFDRARVLSIAVTRGDWSPRRAVAGGDRHGRA